MRSRLKPAAKSRHAGPWALCSLFVCFITATSCSLKPVLTRLVEARYTSDALLTHFTKAVDAANLAVMADDDDVAGAYAGEAETAAQNVQTDLDTLAPVIQELGYTNERQLLTEFATRFARYRQLEHQILALAVENTNYKAQRLASGPAMAAADRFSDALHPAMMSADGTGGDRVLATTAVAAVREIQALQSPHIWEADDGVMTQFEKRMSTAEAAARGALRQLNGSTIQKGTVKAATAALDDFIGINREITALSRRNTDVHSLALSMGEKRTLAAACEDTLHALQAELATHHLTGTR